MKSRAIAVWFLLGLLLACLLPTAATAQAKGGVAYLLHLDGAIGPATADYVAEGLKTAAAQHAKLVILEMDTPGGLSDSMRSINKAILASPVPVVTYVAPSGSRAASAGTYILYASNIAAMAPATNLGAATPVELAGGSSSTPAKPETAEQRKVLNDAVAYIRGLAQLRGRNADWAEQAVRNAASLTADEALQQHVIDLMADNVPALLAQLNGRKVTTDAGTVTLNTVGIAVQDYHRGFRVRFLEVLTNPTLAYILLLIGVFGLIFEALHPGGVLPGVVGAIALLLALYAFHLLPVNFAGLALIVLGIILFVTETFVPSYGTLSIGGLAAFVFGSIILMNTSVPGFQVSRGLIGGIATAVALLIIGILWVAVRAHRRPVVTGAEEIIGSRGQALSDFAPSDTGSVRVLGEIWSARSDTPIRTGAAVRVARREGLILWVEPTNSAGKKES
ncbi:MAG: NfeD family protein [Gammaproteobacteria bacterium]